MASKRVGTVEIGVRLTSAALEGDLRKVQSNLRKLGGSIKGYGTVISRNFSAPLALAGGAAIKFSVDFNKSMANVGTMLTGGEKQLNSYKKAIQDMAKANGESTKDLASGMYSVISAFGEGADNVKQLGVAAEAGIAGLSKTSDAVKLLSTVTKNYGDTSAPAMRESANMAFKAVRAGETTFQELAVAMGRVVPVVSTVGVKQKELWAIMATGAGIAGDTNKAVTGLTAATNQLLKPTELMRKIYKKLEVSSGRQLIAQKGLHGAFMAIKDSAQSMGKNLEDAVGSVEAFNFVAAVTGDDAAKTFTKNLATMSDGTDALGDAFRTQTEGIAKFGFELKRLGRQGEVILQKIGDALTDSVGADALVSVGKLLTVIENMVDAFSNASKATKEFSVAFAGITIALGPVLLGIGTLIKFLGSVLLFKVIVVTTAIAGMGAALYVLRDDIAEVAADIGTSWKIVHQYFVATFDLIERKAPMTGNLLRTAFEHPIANTVKILDTFYDTWIGIFRDLKDATINLVKDMFKGLQDEFDRFLDYNPKLGALWDKFIAKGVEAKGQIQAIKDETAAVEKQTQSALDVKKKWNEEFAKVTDLTTGMQMLNDAVKNGIIPASDLKTKTQELVKSLEAMDVAALAGSLLNTKLTPSLTTAAEATENLAIKLEDLKESMALSEAKGDFDIAISGSTQALETAGEKLQATMLEANKRANADMIKAAGKYGEDWAIEYTGLEYKRIMDKASEDRAKKIAEDEESAHKKSVDFWVSTFENAITGETFNLEDTFKQVAVGFAAEFMSGLTGDLFSGDIKNLGKDLAGSFLSGLESSGITGFFQDLGNMIFGEGTFGGAVDAIGAAKAGGAGGDAAAGGAAAGGWIALIAVIVANAIKGGYERYNEYKDSNPWSTSDQRLSAIHRGAHYGAADTFGLGEYGEKLAKFYEGNSSFGNMLEGAGGVLWEAAKLFHKAFGSMHGDTQQRKAMEKTMRDFIRERTDGQGLTIQDRNNQLVNMTDFSFRGEGGAKHQFDPGNPGDSFLQSLDADAQTTFTGIAKAFARIFDAPDDMNIGFFTELFAENMLGDIDNVRLMVRQLGLSFEELKGPMLDAALTGEISWLEFNSTVAALGEAFEPGLAAVGDMIGAFDNLVGSGGKGMAAAKSVQDLAVETLEAGGTELADLEQGLLAAGANAEDVQKIMEALANRGITSLDQLAGASDELAGSIAGDLEAVGFGFAEISNEIKDVRDAFQELEEIKLTTKELEVHVTATGDTAVLEGQALGGVFAAGKKLTEYAKGGVVHSPTLFAMGGGGKLGLMGEAGPEAIMPLARVGGKLGVYAQTDVRGGAGRTVVYNVDASGAAAGVREEVFAALDEIEASMSSRITEVMR